MEIADLKGAVKSERALFKAGLPLAHKIAAPFYAFWKWIEKGQRGETPCKA